MNTSLPILEKQEIENRIFTIREQQVMFDSHLAEMYGVETKVFNQAVKRNIHRFPESFRFQLTEIEFPILRSQIVTSNDLRFQYGASSMEHGGRRFAENEEVTTGKTSLSQ